MNLGLNPTEQINGLKKSPLYEGILSQSDIIMSQPRGVVRVYEMDSCDLDMMPMVLAQLNLSRINEANRPKLPHYQRECAKVLRDYWFNRDTIDAFLLPPFRKYEVMTRISGLCVAGPWSVVPENPSLLTDLTFARLACMVDRVTSPDPDPCSR
jgi:hypothetical protein